MCRLHSTSSHQQASTVFPRPGTGNTGTVKHQEQRNSGRLNPEPHQSSCLRAGNNAPVRQVEFDEDST